MPNTPTETPNTFSIIVELNGRLGQSLQMGADTKDGVDKIKDVQAKSVTEQTQYHALLQEHIRDHVELKASVLHDGRRKALEDGELERKGAFKLLVFFGGLAGSAIGFPVGNLDNVRKWIGF